MNNGAFKKNLGIDYNHKFKRKCELCGKSLRARQKKNKDFKERKLHIKCWKYLYCY